MGISETLYSVLGIWKVMLNGALEQVRAIMVPVLVKQIKALQIDDVVSDYYTVRNIKIPEFDIGFSEIRVEDGSIVKIVLKNIDLRVLLDWGYKASTEVLGYKVGVGDNGSANISTKNASAMVTARIGFDLATYSPTVSITDADFDIGELDIQLQGGATAIINVITSYFRTEICNLINAQVRARLASTIEDVLRDVLKSKQTMFRNIFFGVIIALVIIFFTIIYFKFFAQSPPPVEPETIPQPPPPSSEPKPVEQAVENTQ